MGEEILSLVGNVLALKTPSVVGIEWWFPPPVVRVGRVSLPFIDPTGSTTSSEEQPLRNLVVTYNVSYHTSV
jgi:hypothetical protein